MLRRIFIGTIGIGLLGAALLAKPGVVTTKEGLQFKGDVVEKEDGFVSITVGKTETRLDTRNVAKIEYTLSLEEQFATKLAKLPATAVAGRIDLARWAYDNKLYDSARDALDEALKIDPTSKQAADLLDMVTRQMELDRKSGSNVAKPPATQGAKGPVSPIIEKKVLTPADVNLVRQKELSANETGLKIRLEGDVAKQFMQASGMTSAEFNRMDQTQRGLAILEKGDPSMSAKVHILTDPVALAEYRKLVQPIIMTGCAVSACHGGPAGGGLVLYNKPGEAEAYTNFYVLQTYTRKIGGTTFNMINRSSPDRSLILLYGLPPEAGAVRHPDSEGYRPPFKSNLDPKFKSIAKWAKETLNPIEPNYGIQFPMENKPVSPVTVPASQPVK